MNIRPAFTPAESPSSLADQAAHATEQTIRSTQRLANETLENLADDAQATGREGASLLNRAARQASTLGQRGVAAVRDGGQQLSDQARRASASTLNYVRDKPVQAVLISAVTGAALMALVSLLRRSRDRT